MALKIVVFLKAVDGCFTRRISLNIDWFEPTTNANVYGHLIRASDKIAERKIRLAGYLGRHNKLLTHQLLLWEPFMIIGLGNIYDNFLRREMGLENRKIYKLMMDG